MLSHSVFARIILSLNVYASDGDNCDLEPVLSANRLAQARVGCICHGAGQNTRLHRSYRASGPNMFLAFGIGPISERCGRRGRPLQCQRFGEAELGWGQN